MQFRPYLLVHVGLVTAGIVALTVAPPVEGQLLLVPLAPGSADGLAALAVARGGRLAGTGPTAGSLVVTGRRDRVTAGLWRRGVIALAGSAVICGDSAPWR